MKRYKSKLVFLEQVEDEIELHPRVTEILDFMKNEDFTNFKKRLDFGVKLLELISLSNDIRIRRLIKKIGQAIKEIEEEEK